MLIQDSTELMCGYFCLFSMVCVLKTKTCIVCTWSSYIYFVLHSNFSYSLNNLTQINSNTKLTKAISEYDE